jgi:hypothetical protein
MKAELRDKITIWLREQGINARPTMRQVAVNRDSMCNSKFAVDVDGVIPEMTTYPRVLAAIEKEFFYPLGYMWSGKTDDDLFLDTLDE